MAQNVAVSPQAEMDELMLKWTGVVEKRHELSLRLLEMDRKLSQANMNWCYDVLSDNKTNERGLLALGERRTVVAMEIRELYEEEEAIEDRAKAILASLPQAGLGES
jgi:hypothetical protein